jgi:hypothetical protein
VLEQRHELSDTTPLLAENRKPPVMLAATGPLLRATTRMVGGQSDFTYSHGSDAA